jgi:ABC-type uncharacterized transport system auxiliary subunit
MTHRFSFSPLKKTALLVFTAVSLCSCASLFPSAGTSPKRFMLQSIDKRISPVKTTLSVDQPVIDPPYDTQRVVLKKSSQEIDYFANIEWVNRPSELVESALVQSLLTSNAFLSVARTTDSLPSHYRIKVYVKTLAVHTLEEPEKNQTKSKKSFFSRSHSCEDLKKIQQALLLTTVQIINSRSRQVVASESFNNKKNLDTQNRQGVMKALDMAFTHFQEDLLSWLEKILPSLKSMSESSVSVQKSIQEKKTPLIKKEGQSKKASSKKAATPAPASSGAVLSRRL